MREATRGHNALATRRDMTFRMLGAAAAVPIAVVAHLPSAIGGTGVSALSTPFDPHEGWWRECLALDRETKRVLRACSTLEETLAAEQGPVRELDGRRWALEDRILSTQARTLAGARRQAALLHHAIQEGLDWNRREHRGLRSIMNLLERSL